MTELVQLQVGYNSTFIRGQTDRESEKLYWMKKRSAWQWEWEVLLLLQAVYLIAKKNKTQQQSASCTNTIHDLSSQLKRCSGVMMLRKGCRQPLNTLVFVNESLDLTVGSQSVISGWLSDPLLSLQMPHYGIWEDNRGILMERQRMKENSTPWKWCCPPTQKYWQTALGRKALSAH